MVLSETIGQWKWLYYQSQPRRPGNIDAFHEASQGPRGALKFLFKIRTSSLVASIASAITVLSLAFGPMAQQVLSYQQRLVVNPGATSLIPTAQIYSSKVAPILNSGQLDVQVFGMFKWFQI